MDIEISSEGPLLIFGGPYSNLQATLAMRNEAGRLGIPPARVICTGDVAAYCANPEETVQLIRNWGCHVIKGNCEESLGQRADDCACGFEEGTACDLLSKGWYPYADAQLSDASREWMRCLPDVINFTLAGRRATVIHGVSREISRFIFASTPDVVKQEEFALTGAEIIIAGHCGLPFIQRLGERIWFNAGVIGMPANDGTPGGWFGLIATSPDGRITFTTRRLNYDANIASGRLRDAGSASPYADALTTGLWPSLDVLPDTERAATGQPLAETELVIG